MLPSPSSRIRRMSRPDRTFQHYEGIDVRFGVHAAPNLRTAWGEPVSAQVIQA